jgi:PIN domain nuclease of toxin-antitoxin system
MTADTDMDGRWMTYAELAAARGIDHQSARRLASRSKWRRQKDNHQIVRVFVPSTVTWWRRRKQDMSMDTSAAMTADVTADMSRAISAFESALAFAQEQVSRSEVTTAALREQLAQADDRAERAEQALSNERARMDMLRDQSERMIGELRIQLESERSLADQLDGEMRALKATQAAPSTGLSWWRRLARRKPSSKSLVTEQ